MKIGYARVSTKDQNLDVQLTALKNLGCEMIFKEKVSAAKERKELNKMLETLRPGDTVVVWRLDRLGRSLKHLVETVNFFSDNNIAFISMHDKVDTTTSHGRLVFNIFASIAEFERELIRERTQAGLKAARLKGHFSGRKPGLKPEDQKKARLILKYSKKKSWSVADIMEQVDVSKSTYYRYLAWAKKEEAKMNKDDITPDK